MNYLAIKDLKQTRALRELLVREREVVLTKDGRPFALIIGVCPETLEDSLREVRRALFSNAVLQARRRALQQPPKRGEIDDEIAAARRAWPPYAPRMMIYLPSPWLSSRETPGNR